MDSLKIRTKTMIGGHHSWAVTMRSIFNIWIKQGHECFINTANNYDNCPENWSGTLDRECSSPNLDICYTLPRNFSGRFHKASKKKMAIYNYETSRLPSEWVSDFKYIDYALPSSNFSKDIFVNSGIEKSKCVVVPHGINIEDFKNKKQLILGNDKTFRFLNVSIPHWRKNINILLEAYYTAFSGDDDVCLVLKTDLEPPKDRPRFDFEADVAQQIMLIQKHYKNLGKKLPQIEIIQQRLDDMIPLYNSCQCLVSAASSEGFGLPLLEGLAADMLVISPRCSGQLDFLNDSNSILYKTNEVLADKRYQYWRVSEGATTYLPHKNDLAIAMYEVYKNYNDLQNKFSKGRLETLSEFTWENAANKIMELV